MTLPWVEGGGQGGVNEVRVWEGSLRMKKGCERRQRPRCTQVQGTFNVVRVDSMSYVGASGTN